METCSHKLWFAYVLDIQDNKQFGKDQLISFINGCENFLKCVLFDPIYEVLFKRMRKSYEIAQKVFTNYMSKHFTSIKKEIKLRSDNDTSLIDHGLVGEEAAFKHTAIYFVSKLKVDKTKFFSIRSWFKKMVDAIDVLLDSILDVVGVGKGLKEFKDMLSAIV